MECLIPLSRGQFARVDEQDYETLMAHKWHAVWSAGMRSYYAARTKTVDGVVRSIKMHRQILGLSSEDRLHVDHVNRDTLDNRRSNLRVADHRQNHWNQAKRSDNTCGCKGVIWDKSLNLYRARITVNGRRIHLGYRKQIEDAADLYRFAAVHYFGKFARSE